jgi:hypothetical protein
VAIYSHEDKIYSDTLCWHKNGKLKHIDYVDSALEYVCPDFYSDAIFIEEKV